MSHVLAASTLKRLYADGRFTLVSVLSLTIGIGFTVAIFSLVCGVLVASVAATRFLASLLFVVSSLDLLAPLVLFVVTLLASLLLAERAARVDPLEALRQE